MRQFTWLFVLGFLTAMAQAQPSDSLTPEQQQLVDEHVYGGLPSDKPILVRQGYVSCYDRSKRVPEWVAYHVTPDYLETPARKGKFQTFRVDPDIANPVKSADYTGLLASRGYARGHLAPYAVMGGDRDGDSVYASDDDDDALTIFQCNYMSNMAPQHHSAFNGSGGLWYKLERWIQNDIARDRGIEVWVFAGCIFGPGYHEKVGPNQDIVVPPMFYKIVIQEPPTDDETPLVLAFLFPHQRSTHGDIQDFLVTVDVIEALTGLDFFHELEDETEEWLEDTDTWEFWDEF